MAPTEEHPQGDGAAPDLRPWVVRVAWVLVGLGLLARLVRYLANRSIWRDEAALALNLLERGFAGLLAPLDHDQVAPIGFLWLARGAVTLLGSSELALRLVPFVCGLGALYLFHRFVREFLAPGQAAVALALFALSEPLVFYSSELKQYSSDVLACLLVLWPGARVLCRGASPRRLAALAVAGVAAVWLSIPAVYVLGAVGGALILAALGQRRPGLALVHVLISAAWVGCFAAHYSLLRAAQENSYLAESWETFLAPRPGLARETLDWYRGTAFALFNDPLGFPATGIAALAFLAGTVVAARRRWSLVLLLAGPLALSLLASVLGFMPFPTDAEHHLSERSYPFIGRLLLFLAPTLLAGMGAGLAALLTRPTSRWAHAGPIAAALLVAAPLVQLVVNTVAPPTLHEARPLLAAIAEAYQPGDQIYTQTFAACPVAYYARRLGLPAPAGELGVRRQRDQEDLRRKVDAIPRGSRFWVVTLHHPHWKSEDELKDIRMLLRRSAERLQSVEAARGEATLYEAR